MTQEERIKAMAAIMVAARQANEDIGEIIAASLHAAAHQLGDVEYLVLGRPGSWEADIVRRMAQAGENIGISLTQLYQQYIEQLLPLFVAMGEAKEDGGDILSLAMSQAVDTLGGLDAFAGQSRWYHDLTNIGRQYSSHYEQFGDYSEEFLRDMKQKALTIISQYEQIISQYEPEVTEIIATPEHEEADWRATFADGHTVTFWIADHQRLLENKVHIVSRS